MYVYMYMYFHVVTLCPNIVLLRVQNQVSNVIGIMKDNISRVMDRGEKLDSLEEKSGWLIHTLTHRRAHPHP